MEKFNTIEFELSKKIGTVWLNRPEIHNAFNAVMLKEIIECYSEINKMNNVRVVVIRGRGKSFSAGADLNWMRDVAKYSYQENYNESLIVSECFKTIYTCKKPTIAIVHGAAIGGANGFIAASDYAFTEENTTFSLSEVKIGIVPACISPYILKRVGEFGTKDLMLSGRRIKGNEAEKYKLVNKSLPESELNEYLEKIIRNLMTSGPYAMTSCKNLLYENANLNSFYSSIDYTANQIAERRASKEGQEGMASFLEKRKPNWIIK